MQRLILVDGIVRTDLTTPLASWVGVCLVCRGYSCIHAQTVIALGLEVELKLLD